MSELAVELRTSVRECSARGLLAATKWLSELLLSVPKSNRQSLYDSTFSTSTPAKIRHSRSTLSFVEQTQTQTEPESLSSQLKPTASSSRHPHAPPLQPVDHNPLRANLELQEQDALIAARLCFENKEFVRVPALLKGCTSDIARFMSIYSRFLVSEHNAELEWHNLDEARHQPPTPGNDSLLNLLQEVINDTDPWLLFLKALFLSRLSRRPEAIEAALLSIAGFPWNWSTWTLLANCIKDGEELSALLPLLPLPPTHPLVQMFQVKTLNDLQNPTENEVGLCDSLLGPNLFPSSLWVMTQRATALYHLHDFGQAEAEFDRILALDPYRIDDIDVLSNILYVTDNRIKLTRLAHDYIALDKDRPEVCCLVGNHYSMRAEHAKAIKYFRRATQLDRTFLSAWTLMGHEYVEMKNSHAAIEAYRRAVDVNRKDYRAWYGLGQAYELLNMHQYALHYYQYATALRPYDVRLWQAQGMCYQEMGRLREAVECLKRALISADPHEITINLMLAKIYRQLKEPAEAVAYHRRVVEVCQADLCPIQDYAKSSIEVAAYQLELPDGDLFLAQEYLERVASSNAEDVVRAGEMLKVVNRKIQERMQSEKGKGRDKEMEMEKFEVNRGEESKP